MKTQGGKYSRSALEAAFKKAALEACQMLSASRHTRIAYANDVRQWIAFCRLVGVTPQRARPSVVVAWVEVMKKTLASKTRIRRLSALSSVYRWLGGNTKEVGRNPFSILEGPRRESAFVVEPTPIAQTHIVAAAQKRCDEEDSFLGVRDAAILRVLWATGIRRSSLAEITFERLVREGDAYVCNVPAKRGKVLKVWFSGRASEALTKYIVKLAAAGISSGPIFRRAKLLLPMTERDIWRAVRRRGKQAGGELTPHGFRVAFLTLNPASIDERQDAAGHSSPDVTRLYDRTEWRGKKAFVSMPEVEAVDLNRKDM